jgi:hypothetical protein
LLDTDTFREAGRFLKQGSPRLHPTLEHFELNFLTGRLHSTFCLSDYIRRWQGISSSPGVVRKGLILLKKSADGVPKATF